MEVHDNSARLPRRRDYGVDATTGRGIDLVVALSDDWGVTTNNAGKIVWATVRADDESARSFADSAGDRGWTV